MENIGEMTLYSKGKRATTYAVVRLGYGGKAVKGGEGHLYSDGIYWVLCLSWLNLDKGPHLDPTVKSGCIVLNGIISNSGDILRILNFCFIVQAN
jgi:hypothetical protein